MDFPTSGRITVSTGIKLAGLEEEEGKGGRKKKKKKKGGGGRAGLRLALVEIGEVLLSGDVQTRLCLSGGKIRALRGAICSVS